MAFLVIDEKDIYYLLPIIEALIRGYCFYYLIKPFMISTVTLKNKGMVENFDIDIASSVMGKKRNLFYIGMVYFFIMFLLYLLPFCINIDMAYLIGSIFSFFFISWFDQRNYRQKAFLVILFFSLNWLSTAMAEILYDNLYAFAENTNYMKSHSSMFFILYVSVCIVYLTLELLFTVIGSWQILKVYKNKSTDMKKKELIILIIPSLVGVIAYKIIQNYRIFYIVENGKNKGIYDIFIVIFYLIIILAIFVMIILYQDIKAKQEENQQMKFLSMQIENIKHHMEQVESLYQNIRSIKHDMTNHILTLEKLYEGNKIEEAKAYQNNLKEAFDQITGEIESGNPVINVILQEFKKEAEENGISFYTEFYYPFDFHINVFDLSVILHNALRNAIENTEKEKSKVISIVSYRRNNAYIIETCNSFFHDLQWDMESGLLLTSKDEKDCHGYGLLNIRRVARKYHGDIDITLKNGEFCLCIMLMLE